MMRKFTGTLKRSIFAFLLLTLVSSLPPGSVSARSIPQDIQAPSGFSVYIPLVSNPSSAARRINAPYFGGSVSFGESAIFWFGKVTPATNYTDVRIAYTQSELWVYLAVFDRLLWYDPTHAASDLTKWDSASLYLNLKGNTGSACLHPAPTASTPNLTGGKPHGQTGRRPCGAQAQVGPRLPSPSLL